MTNAGCYVLFQPEGFADLDWGTIKLISDFKINKNNDA